jgi:hypothetical protein
VLDELDVISDSQAPQPDNINVILMSILERMQKNQEASELQKFAILEQQRIDMEFRMEQQRKDMDQRME